MKKAELIDELHRLQEYLENFRGKGTECGQVKQREELALQMLEILNQSGDEIDIVREILLLIKKFTGFEAVGIRLSEGDDFPYYQTTGFPPDFVEAERYLCARDEAGETIRDSSGSPVLECMCGNVIRGRTDPSLPFFTDGGSFWTNSTSKLLASTTEEERQSRTRNRCNGEGYESVALIPLRTKDRVIGLLQLNDRRKGLFSLDTILFFERIGNCIGVAFVHRRSDQQLDRRRVKLEDLVRQRTAALAKSEESLAEAQRISHLGNWDLDIVKNTLWWSDEIYRIFGLTPQEFGATYDAFLNSVHPDDRESVKEAVSRALHYNAPYIIDHRIVLPDGSERIVHEQAAVFRDEDGKAVRMVGIVQDITDRKKLEEQLLQAQKMESIGRLAGGVAHDFNNLLVVIGGRARRALKGLERGTPLRKEIEEVIRAQESASSLTRQLLAFGRKQMLRPKIVDLNSVLSDMEMMLRRLIGENIAFLTLTEPDLGRVEVDRAQIEQVIMNLAINARDAMPGGGRLTVRTSNVHLDEEHPTGYLAPPGSYVLLEVGDTGSGMDGKTLSRIFEPFFTTKPPGEGTGLGLSTVYGIVRQSGGDIRVYSEPGLGTTFKIYLPRVEDAAGEGERKAPGKLSSLHGTETILLVEDEDIVRELAALELRELGYTVFEAADGAEALRICAEHEGQIHLMITDVVMPGMSGPDLFKLIVEERPGIEVLYCSGYARQDIIQRGILDQGRLFLEKPFTAEELALKAREALDH